MIRQKSVKVRPNYPRQVKEFERRSVTYNMVIVTDRGEVRDCGGVRDGGGPASDDFLRVNVPRKISLLCERNGRDLSLPLRSTLRYSTTVSFLNSCILYILLFNYGNQEKANFK